jgi:hypothetical protein
MENIKEIFDKQDIEIYKYYILKQRRLDEYGSFAFNETTKLVCADNDIVIHETLKETVGNPPPAQPMPTNVDMYTQYQYSGSVIETFADGEALAVLKIYKDQHGQLSLAGQNSVKKMKGATGVFSKVRGSGIVDIESAKKWLNKTLGIDDTNIIVTNGVMRSFENDPVYGLTIASLDTIYNEIVGNIMLSSQSGAGVEYHEAWHYVNLLLHNKLERNAIYKDFARAKGFDANTTLKGDIEEEMAEDFRRWMLM